MDRADGKGVADARVDFLPLEPSNPASPGAATSGDGRWEISLPSGAGADSVRGVFRVAAPGELPYHTDTVTVHAFSHGGGQELGRWTSAPFFAWTGELRFPDGQPREAVVTFTRNGGGAAVPEKLSVEADRFGRFFFQLDLQQADAVVGSFRIEHPDMPAPVTIQDVRMPFKYRDEALPLDRVLRVGPSLEYVGRLWRRRAGEHVPAEGVEMELRRIGGIEVFPDVKRSTTVDWGGFNLVLGTYQTGTVVGELSGFLPPANERVVLDTLALATFDTDELRDAGEWVFGPQIHYEVGLRDEDSGNPLPGIPVVFERTGGIPSEPSTLETTTDQDGLFRISLHTEQSGELQGELRVTLPGGAIRTITDVRLEAHEDDVLHFLGWLEP